MCFRCSTIRCRPNRLARIPNSTRTPRNSLKPWRDSRYGLDQGARLLAEPTGLYNAELARIRHKKSVSLRVRTETPNTVALGATALPWP